MADLSYGWEKLYHNTLNEEDPTKLQEKVWEIEGALFIRSQELALSSDGHVERAAISKATEGLLKIKTDKLNWPTTGLKGH